MLKNLIFQKALTDDEKIMRRIIENTLKNLPSTYGINKALGLCRVSFSQTYGRKYTGPDLEKMVKELWGKR